MVNTTPNPIKAHYIAYFDILGYKDFFANQPEKAEEFLNVIHQAVNQALASVQALHQSPMISQIAKMVFKIKVFSDNFLICLETTETENDPVRLLTLIQTVADIQIALINDYGLFVRGCIIKGDISFNDDYVFGKGLIDAVYFEGKVAKYPRIIISRDIVEVLTANNLYNQEDVNWMNSMGERIKNNETVSDEEQKRIFDLYHKSQFVYFIMQATNTLISQWPDENWFVSYLQRVKATEFVDKDLLNVILQTIQMVSPSDYQTILKPSMEFDSILKQHKKRVEEQLIKFGNNKDIEIKDSAKADEREKVLRKYIWSMTYHNLVCDAYKKAQYKIYTECNCDVRFLKTIIKVQNDEHKE